MSERITKWNHNFDGLGALCDALNEKEKEICDRYPFVDEIESYFKLSELPTFGGTDPSDTEDVWSWDEDHLLMYENGTWILESRGEP